MLSDGWKGLLEHNIRILNSKTTSALKKFHRTAEIYHVCFVTVTNILPTQPHKEIKGHTQKVTQGGVKKINLCKDSV